MTEAETITETITIAEAEYNALLAIKEQHAKAVKEIDRLTWALRQAQTTLKQEQIDHQQEYALLLKRVTGQ